LDLSFFSPSLLSLLKFCPSRFFSFRFLFFFRLSLFKKKKKKFLVLMSGEEKKRTETKKSEGTETKKRRARRVEENERPLMTVTPKNNLRTRPGDILISARNVTQNKAGATQLRRTG